MKRGHGKVCKGTWHRLNHQILEFTHVHETWSPARKNGTCNKWYLEQSGETGHSVLMSNCVGMQMIDRLASETDRMGLIQISRQCSITM